MSIDPQLNEVAQLLLNKGFHVFAESYDRILYSKSHMAMCYVAKQDVFYDVGKCLRNGDDYVITRAVAPSDFTSNFNGYLTHGDIAERMILYDYLIKYPQRLLTIIPFTYAIDSLLYYVPHTYLHIRRKNADSVWKLDLDKERPPLHTGVYSQALIQVGNFGTATLHIDSTDTELVNLVNRLNKV